MSLDVTSLFTNIPKELVIQGIRNRWNDIKNITKMSLAQFLDAIDLVLSSAFSSMGGTMNRYIVALWVRFFSLFWLT